MPTNTDVNSGDPIGMGMGSVSISKGQKVTTSIACLTNPPYNLTVLPDASVVRIIFETKRAVGVQTVDGRKILAIRDVIISGGALSIRTWASNDILKILLLLKDAFKPVQKNWS